MGLGLVLETREQSPPASFDEMSHPISHGSIQAKILLQVVQKICATLMLSSGNVLCEIPQC